MDVLGAMGTILVAGAVLIPGAALVSLILRASRETANTALVLLAGGVAAVLVGMGAYAVLCGAAKIRQAQWAKPSHNIAIDKREQHIDARRQSLVVDANGQPVQLPPGQKIVEVMQ